MLKADLLNYLYEKTMNYSKNQDNYLFTSQNMSEVFNVKRNTISHYINQMVTERQVIKINTRPVYFFHRDAFEKKFFIVS